MRKPDKLLPELHAFVDEFAAAPVSASLTEQRSQWAAICRAASPPRPPGLTVRDTSIELPGRTLAARLYHGDEATPAPCLLLLHGGGWVMGDLDTHDAIACTLAIHSGARVLSLDYRLAPEHVYPAALDDSYEMLKTMAADAERFGIDPRRIAVCGDSAGGNLAAGVAIAARDRGGPRLAAQALLYPVLDTDTGRPSYIENAEAPMLGRADMQDYLASYLGPLLHAPPATAMPLRAADLSDLPPAWVHSAEFDPLRDEAFVYSQRLIAAGNEAHYRCARGMVHSFLRAFHRSPAVAIEFEALCGFLRDTLSVGR